VEKVQGKGVPRERDSTWILGEPQPKAEADDCSQSHPVFTRIDREDAGMCFVVVVYRKRVIDDRRRICSLRSKTKKGPIYRIKEHTHTSLYSCPGKQPSGQGGPSSNHPITIPSDAD
jgi:hypothetical protein